MNNRELSLVVIEQAADEIKKLMLKHADDMAEVFADSVENLPISIRLVWKESSVDKHVDCDLRISFRRGTVSDSENFTFVDDSTFGPLFDANE